MPRNREYWRRRARNLCVNCPEYSPDAVRCPVCRAIHNEYRQVSGTTRRLIAERREGAVKRGFRGNSRWSYPSIIKRRR